MATIRKASREETRRLLGGGVIIFGGRRRYPGLPDAAQVLNARLAELDDAHAQVLGLFDEVRAHERMTAEGAPPYRPPVARSLNEPRPE